MKPEFPHRPLLILFLDGAAQGFTVVDGSGAVVLMIPIAGDGIFGPDSCMSRVGSQSPGVTTWAAFDPSEIEHFVANHAGYRLVAEGIPTGSVTIPIEDTGCRSEPRWVGESEAWSQVRASLPSGVPVPMPIWLPSSIDRSRVLARRVIAGPPAPHYEVIYASPNGSITFGLNGYPDIEGSGVGVRVRGVQGALTFSESLWTSPEMYAPRRVRWIEGSHAFTIDSDTFSGDYLLRIAWSLDQTGAPVPKHAVASAPGRCASAVSAEETVRMLLALTGHGARDAIADCFSSEYLGQYGDAGSVWTSLPRATVGGVHSLQPIGGRQQVEAAWAFLGEPGGAWNRQPTKFFLIGLEAGRWRIHEIGGAPMSPPP